MKGRDQLWVSVYQRCLSYRESNEESHERQGSTLGVRLIESHIKKVMKGRVQLYLPLMKGQ